MTHPNSCYTSKNKEQTVSIENITNISKFKRCACLLKHWAILSRKQRFKVVLVRYQLQDFQDAGRRL